VQGGDRVEYAERFLSTLGPVGLQGVDRRRGKVIEVRDVHGSKNKLVVVAWDDGVTSSALSCNLSLVRKDDSREKQRNA
jgi:hypothetical protein